MIRIFIFFILLSSSLFSYNFEMTKPLFQKESTLLYGKEYDLLNYGKFLGRNTLGINFSPTIYTFSVMYAVKTLIPDFIKNQTKGTTAIINNIKTTTFDAALSFSYEFVPLPFMSVNADIGFVNSDIKVYAIDATGGNKLEMDLLVKYSVLPWSLSVRFYPKGRAPYGFFVAPKIGGTYLNIKTDGYVHFENEYFAMETNLYNINAKEHGMYASVELGWRVQLFPKTGANWKVQPALDISILDVGYYFLPWSKNLIKQVNSQNKSFNIGKNIEKYFGIRLLLIPRIGFSIRF